MSDLPWAGIGARKTPPHILHQMTILARRMDEAGWQLRSGGADGADSAFAAGTRPQRRTIFLPWTGYNGLSGSDCQVPTNNQLRQWLAIAERHHPAWHKCGQGVRKLHARNASILLGPDLDRPVKAVVCWSERGQTVGGTGMGLRIAAEHDIPIFNLGSMNVDQAWAALRLLRNSISSATNDAPSQGTAVTPETMARVVHLRDAPPDAIRIDRRTPWGNPFRIGPDGNRLEVIAKFRDLFWTRIHAGDINLDQLAGLHGKNLACHCAPLPCHGDVLAEAAAWAVTNRRHTAAESHPTAAPSPGAASLQTLTRTYLASDACVFRFTKAEWGLFSNFAPLPNAISAAGMTWPTSEHLYQAAKFRMSPSVQQEITAAPSARDAARLGRNRANTPDADWISRRTDAMRWVIRMKREANRELVDSALERTGDRAIVEYSAHDSYWGAKPEGTNLVGRNVLGRLWMELRRHIRDGDPRALASAWPDPVTAAPVAARASAVPSAFPALQTSEAPDPAHDERTRINNGYLALLEATNQSPALIPYQDDFARFRDDVTAALATARQPPEYLGRLEALDQRLAAEAGRSQRATDAYTRLEDLLAQLPHLQHTTTMTDSITDGFAQDCAKCLAEWHELTRDPDMIPHMNQVAGDDLPLRIAALSPYADRWEPTSQNHDHPLIRDYDNLLQATDNKPELLACQPGFDALRHRVQHALSSPTTDPEKQASLQRISSTLDDSYNRLSSVQDLQRQFSRCANDALDLEDWAAAHPEAPLTDCPDYDAWRKTADALVDRYHHMNRDRAFSPHLKDRAEIRAYFSRRLAHLSEPHLQRPATGAPEQAVQQNQSRTTEHDTAHSLGL